MITKQELYSIFVHDRVDEFDEIVKDYPEFLEYIIIGDADGIGFYLTLKNKEHKTYTENDIYEIYDSVMKLRTMKKIEKWKEI